MCRHLALAGLSGALIVVSLAPWTLWPVAFIALVPLLVALAEQPLSLRVRSPSGGSAAW